MFNWRDCIQCIHDCHQISKSWYTVVTNRLITVVYIANTIYFGILENARGRPTWYRELTLSRVAVPIPMENQNNWILYFWFFSFICYFNKKNGILFFNSYCRPQRNKWCQISNVGYDNPLTQLLAYLLHPCSTLWLKICCICKSINVISLNKTFQRWTIKLPCFTKASSYKHLPWWTSVTHQYNCSWLHCVPWWNLYKD